MLSHMKHSLNQRLLIAITLLGLISVTAAGQTEANGDTTVVTRTDQTSALRTAKYIFVKSSSVVVGASVVEAKLQKRSEFQSMGLIITRDAAAADIVLEVHHDLFTKYVYTAVDPKTNIVVAGGKLSSLFGTVAGKVAKRFMKQMLKARQR